MKPEMSPERRDIEAQIAEQETLFASLKALWVEALLREEGLRVGDCVEFNVRPFSNQGKGRWTRATIESANIGDRGHLHLKVNFFKVDGTPMERSRWTAGEWRKVETS